MRFKRPHKVAMVGRNRQRGVAAIEFALVFFILFSALYALATFGAVLYTQQVVSRAAEEGARAVGLLTTPLDTSRVKDAVYDTLANSLVVPALFNSDVASRRTWIVSQVSVDVTPSTSTPPGLNTSYIVTVSYPYGANRLLPSMLVLDSSRWMPESLTSRATASLAS